MTNLISRKAAMDVFMGKPPGYYHTSYIVGEINSLPSVKAEPVKRGRWIDMGDATVVCSECNNQIIGDLDYDFCPNCGAKMEEERP